MGRYANPETDIEALVDRLMAHMRGTYGDARAGVGLS